MSLPAWPVIFLMRGAWKRRSTDATTLATAYICWVECLLAEGLSHLGMVIGLKASWVGSGPSRRDN
jgi:hypothetical protein|uniref:Uncharacterized protein n=1 Tax=Picea glauca TaxID=3330 RepID=A0A117NID1_PICGL|nr:hypothetical protein ABT39_MTgene2990 [Picea glauca]